MWMNVKCWVKTCQFMRLVKLLPNLTLESHPCDYGVSGVESSSAIHIDGRLVVGLGLARGRCPSQFATHDGITHPRTHTPCEMQGRKFRVLGILWTVETSDYNDTEKGEATTTFCGWQFNIEVGFVNSFYPVILSWFNCLCTLFYLPRVISGSRVRTNQARASAKGTCIIALIIT